MNLSFHIAKRYLFSKKSHNAINVISMVSVCGIVIATAALICVLSVFNGFTTLADKTFGAFDPDLQITPTYGKVFSTDSINLGQIAKIQGVDFLSETLEENALIKYSDRQKPILFKGVSPQFVNLSEMNKLIIDGQFQLRTGDIDYGVLGATLAYELGVRPGFLSPLEIYVPKRNVAVNMMNPSTSFNQSNVFLSGVFTLNQAKYDEQMFIISIDLAREILNYDNEVTAIDVKLKEGYSTTSVKKELQTLLGDKYAVKNRLEQQEQMYKMVSMEKWMTFLIVIIISAIAIFNVVGSLSMLIIEKKGDIAILRSMGANNQLIEKIFLYEGWLIVFLGSFVGIILGFAICYAQQTFGLIKLGGAPEVMLMDAYPVTIQALDIVVTFFTVCIIGFSAVLYPVSTLRKNLID